ncbi:hypothetical protein [Salipaludibacillus aurantiacus]|uniref:Uncharacterized protein n=1 Tax=Salipaludibacillus aurantiacus TaxID=1601833 RepID=A0A1H9PLD2_9BACI|nr:hypothetical protein [Salipaludibacillus aurantiacus]SER48383.1 hypothetical protein SAMN05518684_101349 [Salipaludibacillus aurantiacus]
MSILLVFLLAVQTASGFPCGDSDYTDYNENSNALTGEVMYETSTLKPHFNYYYELLFEKHRPDLMEEWKEVGREREALTKKLKEFNKEKRTNLCDSIPDEWYEHHQLAQERFLQSVKERETSKIKISLYHLLAVKKTWNEEMKEALKKS